MVSFFFTNSGHPREHEMICVFHNGCDSTRYPALLVSPWKAAAHAQLEVIPGCVV